MRRTNIRAVNLHALFGCSSPQLNSRILRLAVLYEDLRLELAGTGTSDDLTLLQRSGIDYCKFYFIRRATATVNEFAEAFRLLDEFPEFHNIKANFSAEHRVQWDECVSFFKNEEDTLQAIRNDIGGHFGQPAALYAVGNLHNAGTGMLEIHQDQAKETAGMVLKFAEQVVAAAMSRQKRNDETSRDFFERIFSLLNDAFMHAVRSTELIGIYHILPMTRR